MAGTVYIRITKCKHVSDTLKEILTNTYDNEMYECTVSKEDVGLSFKALVIRYMGKNDVIIVGIVSNEPSGFCELTFIL